MPRTLDAARVLLAGLELIERRPPRSAAELRRWDRALCDAVALAERDDPRTIAAIYAALAARRGAPPWWAFRPWQRLSAALRTRLEAGDDHAEALVLELLERGNHAAPLSNARWHAEWAARNLLRERAL